MERNIKVEIFKRACLCRKFEERVYKEIEKKTFSYPLYLSLGEEFIPASVSTFFQSSRPQIFAQHRGHSTYLSFGGSVESLIDQLKNGPGGSASIHNMNIPMFGHDGLMGTQVPIAVGSAFASKKFTIAIMGDASAEEDYVMASIAWAGSRKLQILFIVEDNNLSILTEKRVRRNWEMDTFARSVNVSAKNIYDDPISIYESLSGATFPLLLNIKTNRLCWHAGAGKDGYPVIDRYLLEKDSLGLEGDKIEKETRENLNLIWKKVLEKQ